MRRSNRIPSYIGRIWQGAERRPEEGHLIVAGHTCDLGTDEFNMRLSERRARAVKEYLEEHHGVTPDRLSVKAYGKTKPINSNDTEAGKIRNRRVGVYSDGCDVTRISPKSFLNRDN